ncbi:type II secretion system F family protein [Oceanisphaera avium]|uniref:Type II secretion system protein F n=1 Tax=Oceanisphaera avium TaxID=1903694 RepID=A0A1Y0CZX2_9GAMM|nr:type II secretion system F family protein [Oceanisphaera avium]ART80882.1 type II secretion system protein F [Oceanisphaera avium]
MSQHKRYHWQGMNSKGQTVSGTMVESSLIAVRYQLQRQGIQATHVKPVRRLIFKLGKTTITPSDIAVMTRQLATMLNAGIALVQSLQLIARTTVNLPLKQILLYLCNEVEQGQALSKALHKYPAHFTPLYRDLVYAGEQTGTLDIAFEQLADYAEKAERLRLKIRKALFYPTLVLIVAALVSAILLLWVIPQFAQMYNSFGAPLPWFTQLIIDLSRALQNYGVYLALILFTLSYGFITIRRRSVKLRRYQHLVALKLPVLGNILSKAALMGFARTLAATFSAGLPLIEGLTLAAGASGNAIYRHTLLQIRSEVLAGVALHQALAASPLFPELMIQLTMIGEETGRIDDMMHKIANIYETEVDSTVEALASLIEPVMMLILGVLVGGLVIAMYLPIFSLGSVIH